MYLGLESALPELLRRELDNLPAATELRVAGLRFVLDHLAALLEHDRQRPGFSLLNSVISEQIITARKVLKTALKTTADENELPTLEVQIRELLRVVPGIVFSREWMSPSLGHSLTPQRGRYCDLVSFASFDYKRDRHREAEVYEAAFLAELQKLAPFNNTRCYLTSCGMSSVATALSFLRGPLKLKGRFAASDSLYFENANLLEYFGSEKPAQLDLSSTAKLLKQINELEPQVVFLDSIENSPGLRSVDLRSVVSELAANYTKPIFLVLDVTTTPLFSLPFLGELKLPAHINILAIESLAKFHQLGLDVGTGGIVALIGSCPQFDLFPGFREKFGSNLSDISTASLPPPNFSLASMRYLRACTNTRIIETLLRDYLKIIQSSFISEVETADALPGSINERNPGAAGTALFNLRFKNYSLLRSKNQLLTELILVEAARRGVNVISGTSFGFDTTRIYLTAPSTDSPFMRIAPGIEDSTEALLIAETIAAAISELEREYH